MNTPPAIPKAGISFSHHSPNAEMVTEHLKNTDYDIVIAPQDVLCFSCYKPHFSILKSLNSSNDNGSESGLQQNIKAWKNTNDSIDLHTSAVLSAVLFVAYSTEGCTPSMGLPNFSSGLL